MVRGFLSLVAASSLVLASPALAQPVVHVPLGSDVVIENDAECTANADVQLTLLPADGVARVLGFTIADPSGHFRFEGALDRDTPMGAATITASCGLGDSVLVFDVLVVEAVPRDLADYAPAALIGVGAVALLAFVVLRTRKKSAADVDVEPELTAPEPEAVTLAGLADATADAEDDPDYWFWDAVTTAGAVKRLACLSHDGFYLHEVAQSDFGQLLERLAHDGPDIVLADAFFAVQLIAIDQVHRRGSQLRVMYHDAGERTARVIDLGTEAEGVVDLLSRRVQVRSGDALAGR